MVSNCKQRKQVLSNQWVKEEVSKVAKKCMKLREKEKYHSDICVTHEAKLEVNIKTKQNKIYMRE